MILSSSHFSFFFFPLLSPPFSEFPRNDCRRYNREVVSAGLEGHAEPEGGAGSSSEVEWMDGEDDDINYENEGEADDISDVDAGHSSNGHDGSARAHQILAAGTEPHHRDQRGAGHGREERPPPRHHRRGKQPADAGVGARAKDGTGAGATATATTSPTSAFRRLDGRGSSSGSNTAVSGSNAKYRERSVQSCCLHSPL